MPQELHISRRSFAALAASAGPWVSLFVLVVGARLWLISVYATPLPYLDQWDAEAGALFKPWLENNLRWADLFAAHNEHRMVPSRLLALGLLALNGQWDGQLEMVGNALLCGTIGLGVAFGLARLSGEEFKVPLLVAVTLWLGLPYGYENTLWGFQSAFYFLLLFSLVTIWGLGFFAPFSLKWWIGAAAALLACLSMASGFFAAGAVVSLVLLRIIVTRGRELRVATPTLILCFAVIGLGLSLRVHFPPHDSLRAASIGAWIKVFARCLAWPYCAHPLAAALIYLPWFASLRFLLNNPHDAQNRRRLECIFAGGLWVIVQAAAIAYARGQDGSVMIYSRYMDILAFGALLNGIALLVLLRKGGPVFEGRRFAIIGSGVWLAITIAGASALGMEKLRSGSTKEVLLPIENNVRAYVATHDQSYLASDIPYPDSIRLAILLDDPVIQKILPVNVRAPVPIEMHTKTGDAFVSNGHPSQLRRIPYVKTWGSFSEKGSGARGSSESEVFHPQLPLLLFEQAAPTQKGISLQLRNEESGRTLRVEGKTRIEHSWRSVVVTAPGRDVKVIAEDDNSDTWFAFREPRELGRLSYYAGIAATQGKRIFLFGLTLAASLGLAAMLSPRLRGRAQPTPP